MKNNSVHDCPLIELNRNTSDRRGTLSVVGAGGYAPFDIRRAYYLYDVPGGESRGGHSHKTLHELIVAASGSFTVTSMTAPIKEHLSQPSLRGTLHKARYMAHS